ncbi:MAG TPA: Do family serine endopeptidase [Beijerinckiaceae bacterium]|nr:Do family serine endopeptidase [Beijerinckiaceae bacterium]
MDLDLPRRKRSSAAVLTPVGLSLALALVMGAPAPVSAARGPGEISDVADQVVDAVVNISATTTEQVRGLKAPGDSQNTPFDDLFDDFFNRKRQGQGDVPPQPPRMRKSNSLGSGFVIDPSGVVVTNNHVVGEASDIEVIFTDGSKLKAEVVGKDAKIDLAVLRVKPDKPLKAVKFGDSEKMRIGQWVMAVGNPFGLGGSVTAGIISARHRNIDSGSYDDYLQTDAAINRGNSGGPLFNLDGEVIGINTAILSPTGGSIGIGFAIPSNLARPVLDQLAQFGEVRRGWLGVQIQNVDESIAETLGLGKARGALVAGVDDRGPAKPAGIKKGDVIVKFNGDEVKESRDLPRMVAATPVGKLVEVVVIRDGKETPVNVTLGRLQDDKVAALTPPQNDTTALKKALGLDLSPLTDDLRRRYSIKDGVKGAVITGVDPNSTAADKRLQPGDVIVEIGQQPVSSPSDVAKLLDNLKKDGKKSALLYVANAQGDMRYVALAME